MWRKIAACILMIFSMTAKIAFSNEGDIDTTFAPPNGFVTYNGGGNDDDGYSVALQIDGKIVIAGDTWNGTDNDVLILRYNSNGTIDSGFGNGGAVTYNGGPGRDDYSYSVAVDLDGKIVVAGNRWNGTDNDVLILRYNSNGTIDSGFGTGGVVVYNSAVNQDDDGYAIAVQADGKIVVAGNRWNGTDNDLLILRYNSNGTPDSTFGTGGAVAFSNWVDRDDYGFSAVIQADGKIMIAGDLWNGSDYDVMVLRLISDVDWPVNIPPVAVNDSAAVTSGSAVTINVLANDTDADGTIDPSTCAVAAGPSHGTAAANANGTITYTSTAGYAGTDTFTYTVKDNSGATSNAATVTVTVNPIPIDIIIDNGNPGTSYTGSWKVSGGTTPYGTNSLWGKNGATYTWQYTTQPAGTYEVFMWWPGLSSNASNIAVQINSRDGVSTVYINQQSNAGKWNSLGRYYFNGSGGVTIIAAKGSKLTTCADAVKFTRL